MVVRTRNNGSRKRGDTFKEVAGCICCSEKDGDIKHEKTKCGNLITQNGKLPGNTFIHLKNISKVSKKPSGKRSPITHCTVALFKQNCIIQEVPKNRFKTPNTLEGVGSNRGPQSTTECMDTVNNWLRQFQQNVNIKPQQQEDIQEPMEEQSSPPDQSVPERSQQAPDLAQQVPQSTGSPQQVLENAPQLEVQEEVVETIQQDAESSTTGVVYYPAGGPPSAASDGSESSVSAPSPGSVDEMSVTSQGEVFSPASPEEEPDSTSSGAPAASGRPRRTPERREKQRIASAKSRKKKNSEQDQLKVKEKELQEENARLVQTIARLEIERKRYLSGEKNEIDYDPLIYDPQDDSDDDDNAAAGAAALS